MKGRNNMNSWKLAGLSDRMGKMPKPTPVMQSIFYNPYVKSFLIFEYDDKGEFKHIMVGD